MVPGSHWQRWTIDELEEGAARVLIADAMQPLESTVAEAFDSGVAQAIQSAVLTVENVPPTDLWGEERAVFLPLEALEPFVKLRQTTAGLPDPRPLREGDVFWVVLPTTDHESSLRDLTSAEVLASADQLGLHLADITAAARQTAKVGDDAVVRAASDKGSEG
jgi:hypothetical protein